MDVKRELKKKRDKGSHKGNFGKVLVIGGNEVYTGCVTLSGLAALRSGADLCSIISPKRAADTAAGDPNLITVPLEGQYLEQSHLGLITDIVKKADAVVIGSGLGRERETEKFMNLFIRRCQKPCIIDADGIKLLSGNKLAKNFLLTPHAKEFELFTKKKLPKTLNERKKIVKKAAQDFNCVFTVKGPYDITSDGTKSNVNKTGNPYMTVGGTGDVLTGVCGAFMCRYNLFQAACMGAYVTGKAGDLAAKKFKNSLLATDVIKELRNLFK